MSFLTPGASDRQLDAEILVLIRTRRRIMFSDLAEAFCECNRVRLLASLGRLHRTRQLELIAHPWDYEITEPIDMWAQAPTYHPEKGG